MGGDADHPATGIDIDSLEVRRRYRVDWRHEGLRRTFRATGTLLSIEVASAAAPGAEPKRWLALEVKPRFGRAATQRIDVATIRAIEPA